MSRTRTRFKFYMRIRLQFLFRGIIAVLKNGILSEIRNKYPVLPEVRAMCVWPDLPILPVILTIFYLTPLTFLSIELFKTLEVITKLPFAIDLNNIDDGIPVIDNDSNIFPRRQSDITN